MSTLQYPHPARRPRRRLRRFVWSVVALVVLGTLAFAGVFAYAWFTVPVSTFGQLNFEQELKIPPLAESRMEDGTRVFKLTAQQGSTELVEGRSTDTWGFNGDYLGPTLRAERGEDVSVEVTNDLGEETSVHWHGMHLPAKADGGPHQPIAPGKTWKPQWTIDQPAATLWYHPHPHGATADHVYRGLAGLFILDDPDSAVVDRLPHEYGVDDIPVIVQDKRLNSDGELDLSSRLFSGIGVLGEDLVVNGTPDPYLDVTTEKVRLRLLNASTARMYDFGFSDDRTFALVGTDGGLLPEPVRRDRVQLSPGERAEIVVDLQPGEETVLRSYPPDFGGADVFVNRFDGGVDRFDVLQLRAADDLAASPDVPAELADAPDLDVDGAKVREFELSGRNINGKKMEMDRIDETVEVDSTEVWEVRNRDGNPHNFHVHDVQFEVLSVDGDVPGPELAGWKDTIFMPPGRTVRLAMEFTDYTDPDLPYMFHCHVLMHEDQGMMGQFVVVEKGGEAGTSHHAHH